MLTLFYLTFNILYNNFYQGPIMPHIQLFTSLPRSAIPKDFFTKTATLMTQVLKDKPFNRMAVHVVPDQLIFSGIFNYTKQKIVLILKVN